MWSKMNTFSILDPQMLDPRMVGSSVVYTKYVSEWASDLGDFSLNVGVKIFGLPYAKINSNYEPG